MITFTVTQATAEFLIGALRQLPHSQVHDLVMDLFVQYSNQKQPDQSPEDSEQAAE